MTSYIEFKNKGFWINDTLMQFALGYLYCKLKEDKILGQNEGLGNILLENSLGYYASYMHLNLEKHLVNDDDLETFKKCILKIIHELNNSEISESFLKDFCNYVEYEKIEYYLPDKMANHLIISIFLKLLYIL